MPPALLDALERLGRDAPALRALSFEGNPLCELLDVRAHALAHLPYLRSFDGRDVTEEERAEAVVTVRRAPRAARRRHLVASASPATNALTSQRLTGPR